jgi:hypothetical protein
MKTVRFLLPLLVLAAFICLAMPAQEASAAAIWDNGANDGGLWVTPTNWQGHLAPTSTDDVWINTTNAYVKIRPGDVVYGKQTIVARANGITGVILEMTGGTLTTYSGSTSGFYIGQYAGSSGKVKLSNGTITCGAEFDVGYGGTGTLEMTGGIIDASTVSFNVPKSGATGGSVSLSGGTIKCSNFTINTNGSMDISGTGTLIISGDKRTTISGYITSVPPKLTACGGTGTVLYDITTNPGKTTVTALCGSSPGATYLSPADGSTNMPTNTDLSWSTSSLSVAYFRVYFGTSSSAVAGATTASPEYRGEFTVGAFDTVTLSSGCVYYWRIDELNSVRQLLSTGPVWSFATPSYYSSPGQSYFNVSLRAPSTGSSYSTTEYVDVEAYASNPPAGISKVELYLDSSLYGSDLTSPYMWRLTGLTNGAHTLYVKAYDTCGNTAVSETYTICVGNPPIMASRIFSSPPAVGVHPRLVFNAGELSQVYDFWHNTTFGAWMRNKVSGSINSSQIQALASLDLSGGVTAAHLTTYMRADEGRNNAFWLTALDGYVHNDAVIKTSITNAIYNYAQIVIASKTFMPKPTDPNFSNIWKDNGWGVSTNWTFGDGIAMAYDLMYNDMTTTQRDTVRQAIAMVTEGRRAWGMGYPSTRIVSNWAMYNGSLFTTVAVIEGETGFDQQVYDLYLQLAENFFTHELYECGGAIEDGYLQLALREGGIAMIAMARRGHNFFENPHVQSFTRWLAQVNNPFPGGQIVGHSSGGDYTYPSMYTVLKYAFPNDPVVDWAYQKCLSFPYGSDPYFVRSQTYHTQATFGSEVAGPPISPFTGLASNLNLAAFYPRRGLLVTRSDWSENAMYLHYDARSDAYYLGHDNADRGTFTLSALGRSWVPDRAWGTYLYAEDHALMHIDGHSEQFKAPSVKFLHNETGDNVTVSAADLKCAYDYQWSPAWPTNTTTYPSPWVHEDNGPRAVGWPGNEDWLPATLYGLPDFAFAGSYMWRRPHPDIVGGVEKYFRTMVMVRGTSPYVLLIDDVKKDSSSHLYESYIPLEGDISLLSFSGNDIIVGDTAGKRLLFRVIEAGGPIAAHVEDYLNSKTDTDHPTGHPARRLIIGCTVVAPNLKIMIWPLMSGQSLPLTTLSNGIFDFKRGTQQDRLFFYMGTEGRTYIRHDCVLMPASGDVNGDSKVDFTDFALLTSSWLQCYTCSDLAVLTDRWLVGSP